MTNRTLSRPVIEPLESKIAPAGTVTAVIAGGVLTLTGELDPNDLVITELMPDRFQITGQAGTLIKFGSAAGVPTVAFDATVTSIKVDLKEGADAVLFSSVKLVKDVTVNLGIGANTARFDALSIGGNLSIQGGTMMRIKSFSATGCWWEGTPPSPWAMARTRWNTLRALQALMPFKSKAR